MLVLQCKVLQIINIPSKSLQTETYDLFSAHNLLQNTLLNITSLRNKFEELVIEASDICGEWGLPVQFTNRRIRKTKRHFDELSEDERLNDPEKCFRVTVFLPMIDTLSSQLYSRFQGMKSVVEAYQVLQPQFLSNSTETEIKLKAEQFSERFSEDISPLFPA